MPKAWQNVTGSYFVDFIGVIEDFAHRVRKVPIHSSRPIQEIWAKR